MRKIGLVLMLFFSLSTSVYAQQQKAMTFKVDEVSFTMIFVEGGTFMMGGTEEQAEVAEPDEQPVREVKLRNYYIAQTEVTQALWQAVMGYNPSNFVSEDLPVERVSWDEVQKFCAKLSRLTGYTSACPPRLNGSLLPAGAKRAEATSTAVATTWTTLPGSTTILASGCIPWPLSNPTSWTSTT